MGRRSVIRCGFSRPGSFGSASRRASRRGRRVECEGAETDLNAGNAEFAEVFLDEFSARSAFSAFDRLCGLYRFRALSRQVDYAVGPNLIRHADLKRVWLLTFVGFPRVQWAVALTEEVQMGSRSFAR